MSPIERFDGLFDRYSGPLFAYLFGRVGQRDAAADLVQEAFIRTWTSIDSVAKLDEVGQRRWLFAVARNLATDFARRRPCLQRVDLSGDLHDAGPDPAAAMQEGDDLRRLDAAIACLPENLRTVLVMSALEGLTSEDIGTLIGRPAGTVRYQLSEARRRLAKGLMI